MTAISNKHVLITGGASGIGKLLALRCAELGATVTIWDRDEGGGQSAALACGERGRGPACACVCDVGDRDQVAALAAEVEATVGPVDILVNNAGVVSGAPLLELSHDHIERTFRVNTLSLFWVTKAFLPEMVRRGSGHIVNVASAAGLMGSPRQTDYAASKHAAVGFSEALRLELRRAESGVRVTVVCPFYVDTGMFDGVRTRFPFLLPILSTDEAAARILKAIQHDRTHAIMPFMVRTLPAMRLLPVWAFDQLADFFGITAAMDEFVGRAVQTRR